MKPTNRSFPPISEELIKELEGRWPDVMPHGMTTTLDEFRFKQGELAVIRFLRRQFDAQNTTILEGR
jgi:hypothetical protein